MKSVSRNVFAASVLLISAVSARAQTTLVQWNFNGQNSIPSTLDPNFLSAPTASTLNVGTTSYVAVGNNGSSDPQQQVNPSTNYALQASNFPAQGTGSGTSGFMFTFNTTNYTLNDFSYDFRASGGPSGWHQLQYSVNGGSTWEIMSIPNPSMSPNIVDASGNVASSGVDTFLPNDTWSNQGVVPYNQPIDLTQMPDYNLINNNPNFEIRDVAVFSPIAFSDNSGSYAANTAYMQAQEHDANNAPVTSITGSQYKATSTWRMDMVTLTGTYHAPNFTPVNLTWNAASGNWDTNASNQPWLDGATPSPFHQTGGLGDNVTFNNPASGSVITVQAGGVTPNSMNVNTNGTLTFTGGGIGGTGGLTKTGSGTLILDNSNTFTGATTSGSNITGGTLETHYTSPLGTGPVNLTNVNWNVTTNNQVSAGTVTLNGAVSFDTSSNLSLSGGIAGGGTLSKSGPGTLEIGGIGANTGTINVTQGTLQLDSMNALGGNPVTDAVAPDETFSNSNLVFNGTGKGSSGQDAQLTHNITLTNANVSRNDLTPGQIGSSTSNGDSNITAYDSFGNYTGGLMTVNGQTTFTNNELRTAANGDSGGAGASGHSNQLAVNMPIVVTNGSTLTANAINGTLSVTTDPNTGITGPTGTLSNTAVAFHGTSVLNNPNDSITLDAGATLAFVGEGEKRIGSGSTGLPMIGMGTTGAESTFKADAVTFMSDAVSDVNSVNSLFVVAGSGLDGLRIEAPMNANYFSGSSIPDPTTGQIGTSGLFGNNPDTSSTSPGNVYTIMSPNRYAGLSGFTNMPTQTADGAPLPALGGTITLASTTSGTGAVDNGPAAGTDVKLGLDNATATPGPVTYTLDASANGAALNNFGGLVLRQTGSASVTTQLLNDVSLHGSNAASTTYDQLGGTLNLNGHSLTVGAAANISGGEIMGAASSFNAGSINFSGGTLAPESGPSTPGTLTLTGNTTFGHNALLNYELGATNGINSLTEVHGNLTLSGTVDVTGLTGFGAGTYRLMDYTGSLVNNTLAVGNLPAGFTATIDVSVAHEVNLVVHTASVLVGDVNMDGIVNSQDLALISSNWLASGTNPYQIGDVNHDGIVNSQDLALVSSNWLATSGGGAMAMGLNLAAGSTSSVPEPGTYALCLMGAVTTLGWRALRRRPTAA